MFSRTLLRAPSTRTRRTYVLCQSRNFSIIEPLASGIIEVGHVFSSLPLASTIPPYSSAIVAITLALRMGTTLPMVLWSRARADRRENIVGPKLRAWQQTTKETVGRAFAREGKPFEAYKAEMRRLQVAKIKELNNIHRCSPLPTIVAPLAVHAPLFVLATASFRQAALMPGVPINPLASEPFLTLSSLAHTDPTGILPITIGLLMFSNVELGRLSRPAKPNKPVPDNDTEARPTTLLQTATFVNALENGLRGASILFIWVAMQAPGSVVLYWLTSASYTLVERLYFIRYGKREVKAIEHRPSQATSSSTHAISPKARNARRSQQRY